MVHFEADCEEQSKQRSALDTAKHTTNDQLYQQRLVHRRDDTPI